MKFTACRQRRVDKRNTAIVSSGASSIFLMEEVHKSNVDHSSPPIKVGATVGPPALSSVACDLDLPEIPLDFPTKGHIMNSFHENLQGVGPVRDAKYSILFTEYVVTIISPTVTPFSTG